MRRSAVILCFIMFIITGIHFINTSDHSSATPIPFIVPSGWPQPVYDFKQNPVTREGFELGKRLFYDGRLSKDGNFPCASCHQQFGAFATYDHSLSHGFNNSFTTRNAPPLFNLAWQKEFMYDGGVNHLDVQPLVPITAPNEMHEVLDSVLIKLRADKEYRQMFKATFGSELINTQRLTKALSQFLVMIVSCNSLYDKVKRGEATFNLPQRLGYEIFKQKCNVCHTEPLFTDFSYRNVGIPVDSFINDVGRMHITRLSSDSLKFKVPSLRNVMVTFPYGHDGRFYSILDVMNHYRNGVVDSPTTDSLVKHMKLSNYEIGQLTAFLYTLTDSTLLNDIRFSPPGIDKVSSPPLQDIHKF
jgi:cytochrome c peroxidase